jgi:hypothetical protein
MTAIKPVSQHNCRTPWGANLSPWPQEFQTIGIQALPFQASKTLTLPITTLDLVNLTSPTTKRDLKSRHKILILVLIFKLTDPALLVPTPEATSLHDVN